MIKGILIELHENYGVMLTDEGQFLKIKRFGTMIEGQPLYLTEEDIIMDSRIENDHRSHVVDMKHPEKTSKVRKLNTAFLGIIAASMLIFAISATWFFATANTIYTAVIVDINPSIELQLNKNNKVVKLIALNEDALSLDLSALRGKQIEDALELLVSDAGTKGYFLEGDDDYVLVTTVAMKEQSIEALQTRLMQKFEDSDVLQRTNMAFTVITPEQLDDAKENEIPAGLVMIASSGSDTTVKEFFKDEDNVKAFENAGVLVRGTSVDSVTSATTNSSGSDDNDDDGDLNDDSDDDDGDDDSVSEMTKDLKERLIKLKGVSNPSVSIKSFIVKADAYFTTGTGDLRTLTAEAKSLWDGVKGEDDDLDDDSDDDNEGDDDSDDDSNKEDDDDDDSDATTSATQSTTSATQNTTSSTTGSSSDSIADQRADLSERLLKLKGVSNPSDKIKAFIVKADAYFATGTGNLAALTVEAKLLWDGVKDVNDDDDDDSDATTSATQNTTSSTTGSNSDTIADQRADLSERLLKLKGVSNPSDKIKTFIVKADAYFATGTGNLTALYEESKMLWDAVKDSIDDRDDDDEDDEDDEDEDDDENNDDDEDDDEEDDEGEDD